MRNSRHGNSQIQNKSYRTVPTEGSEGNNTQEVKFTISSPVKYFNPEIPLDKLSIQKKQIAAKPSYQYRS